MIWKLYGSAWKCFGRNIMTEWERQNIVWQCLQHLYPLLCLSWVKIFFFLDGRKLGFFCFRRSMTITWSRDMVSLVWWKCKQPGCSCRVMETLPRGNGWKLMTTGGAAKAQPRILASLSLVSIITQTQNANARKALRTQSTQAIRKTQENYASQKINYARNARNATKLRKT